MSQYFTTVSKMNKIEYMSIGINKIRSDNNKSQKPYLFYQKKYLLFLFCSLVQ